MKFIILIISILLFITTIATTINADILIDSPGQDNFSANFKCLYSKAGGTVDLRFIGGTYSQQDGRNPKKLSLYSVLGGRRTGVINSAFEYTHSMTLTGTSWVYVYDTVTGQNVDYIQIEVVANGYTGSCDLQADPPTGWQTNYPPS